MEVIVASFKVLGWRTVVVEVGRGGTWEVCIYALGEFVNGYVAHCEGGEMGRVEWVISGFL